MRRSVLALALVLTGCSSSGLSDAVANIGAPDVDALRVTESETLDVRGGVRLSPDGTRMLELSGPCVTALDGSDEQCVDRDEVGGDLTRAAWSPDSTRLAFTDDFWRHFRDPDVWVFDVTTGELRNLTDDGVADFAPDGLNEGAHLDLLPSWSPDGETVRFARGVHGEESMELMSVPAEGGEVSTIRELGCAVTNLMALAWSAEQVAWTCGHQDAEVLLADQSGGDPETVLTPEKGEDRMLLSFSPNGAWLLVDSATSYSSMTPSGGMAHVVPTDGGDPVAVADGEVAYPAWSPGGQAIAYVELPDTLKVVAEPGGEPKELHSARAIGAPDAMRVNWAPDRMMVIADAQLTLLSLSG